MRRLCLLAVLLVGLAVPAFAQAPKPLTALVLSEQKWDPQVVDYLKGEGISLVFQPVSQPLSQDLLKPFQLVIIPDFTGLGMPLFHDGGSISQYYTTEQNFTELQQYVAGGGGLFVSPWVTGGGVETTEAMRPLLGGWGVDVLAANARDDAHTLPANAPAETPDYSWTTNITASPVTAGVKRLYYPIGMGRWDDAYPTIPFNLTDPRWKPVVRGMAGSQVEQCLQYKTWHPVPGAQNPPILAATAQIGKGRVALFSINPLYTFIAPYTDPKTTSYGEFTTGSIAGIVMEKGDGQTASDGKRLIRNTLRWLGEGGAAQGMGGYDATTYKQITAPAAAPVPPWLTGWSADNGANYYKVLLGARSAYSSGKGSIADWATAAKAAGYAVLIMTEDLDSFTAAKWPQFLADCQAATTPDLVVMPGLDLRDAYGDRLLLFGQLAYPQPWELTPDGKAMEQIQYLMLGFGTCHSAIAHPSSNPLPAQMYKFFSGVVVYTYDADGKLIDDGVQPYETEIYNASQPIPLAVHELNDPAQVAAAAGAGQQMYLMADTPQDAAWYIRDGMSHFWEVPVKVLITSGPMIHSLGGANLEAEDDVPITDVRFYDRYDLLRRWTPNALKAEVSFSPAPGNAHLGFFWVSDQKGRTAISSPLRTGAFGGYEWRCSDRQNFFSVAVNYTGTILSDGVDISVPTFGTDEGKGLWPHQMGPEHGENMCPLLEFPYRSPALTVTDAWVDQRYWRALWDRVAFDAQSPQGTTRSRVYEGRVRYFDLHYEPYGQRSGDVVPLMLMEVELRLRQPVVPTGDLFPAFLGLPAAQPDCIIKNDAGQWVSQKLTKGYLDLPVGGQAADVVALTPGLRVGADGQIGFAPPEATDSALPAGYTWQARYVRLDPKKDFTLQRQALGLSGPTPYTLTFTRGKLTEQAFVAYCAADNGGLAGDLTPYPQMPFPLTVAVEGVNGNWPCEVWQPGAKQPLTPFGVFERRGWARLDVTVGGPFFVGTVVTCSNPALRIGLLDWTKDGLSLELNNPTDQPIEATIATAPEVKDHFQVQAPVKVAAGEQITVKLPK
jgi:hypothetical protein